MLLSKPVKKLRKDRVWKDNINTNTSNKRNFRTKTRQRERTKKLKEHEMTL